MLRNAAVAVMLAASAAGAGAQNAPKSQRIFESETPLAVALTLDAKAIQRDKSDSPAWHAASLSYTDSASRIITVPVKARARGIWRRAHCDITPLRLNFSSDSTKGTVWHNLDKPKLTNYCHDDSADEEYVLQEFQLYRVYMALTPLGHRVRLLHVTYVDSASHKPIATRYGFLIEDPAAMAARNNGKLLDTQGAAPGTMDPFYDALTGVFEYMIGNTDFSAAWLHNIEIVERPDSLPATVPFDFDFSGAVNARYATPDPRMRIHRVRDRQYRGYCVAPNDLARAIARFNDRRSAIYALYSDQLGSLLAPDVVRATLAYFDEFYATIDDPGKLKKEIGDQCRSLLPNGKLSP